MDDKNLTRHTIHDIGVANQIARYSDAVEVGYESDAAFSKAFKRVVGANPGEYLKRGFEVHSNARMAEDF